MLSDIYVARRRNQRGQVYGFVRFINVKDVGKLYKALNNVWFGWLRVWARETRFDRFGKAEEGVVLQAEAQCEGVKNGAMHGGLSGEGEKE